MPNTEDDLLTVTVPLKRRVKHGDAVYTSLTLAEPTVGAQVDVALPGMTPGQVEMALLAKLAGVPVEVIRQVRLADYGSVQAVLANFPYSPATASGEASSASAGQPDKA